MNFRLSENKVSENNVGFRIENIGILTKKRGVALCFTLQPPSKAAGLRTTGLPERPPTIGGEPNDRTVKGVLTKFYDLKKQIDISSHHPL